MSGVFALPPSLVLLLHLHILSYPRCNSPEHSLTSLFAPRRPLRERSKTMEDIVAFLIEKIEGREKCKSVLGGMYPCLQPSDTLRFRSNAAKYMETLRTAVMRPTFAAAASKSRVVPTRNISHGASASFKIKSSINSQSDTSKAEPGTSPGHGPQPVAWWWSAVVVRKSLLEECAGDRFESLLLALSTHALFVQIPPSSPLHPLSTTIPDLASELQNQSQAYASLLSRSLELHTKRVYTVARLNARAQEIISLRTRLALEPKEDGENIETKRLLAIRDSKWQDLVDMWKTSLSEDLPRTHGESDLTAEDALKWFMSMAGVSSAGNQEGNHMSEEASQADLDVALQNPRVSDVQTLPTASAHHPANVRKLGSLPPFLSIRSEESTPMRTSGVSTSLAPPALQALLDNAASQQSALNAALDSAAREGREISRKLDAALETVAASEARDAGNEAGKLELWSPEPMRDLDFELLADQNPGVHKLLSALGISSSHGEESEAEAQQRLESRVLVMRDALHPSIPSPAVPYEDDPQEPLRPEAPSAAKKQHQSNVPLAKSALGFSNYRSNPTPIGHDSITEPQQTPRTPRPYQTSTPPTKSRSRSARATKRTLQAVRSGDRRTSPTKSSSMTKVGNDGRGTEETDDLFGSDGGDVLRTPTGSRPSIPLSVMNNGLLTSRQDGMIADMSLPEFSDGNTTQDGPPMPSEDGEDHENWIEGVAGDDEDSEVPYEGHSITLRDILLRAGDGEDAFYLIDDGNDLEERVGDETMGWD